MSAPSEILALIERFELHKDDYLRGDYNETEVRREFLDPVFKALGWDVDNAQGHAEAYKDVVHEDALRFAGGHKAPDYGFRIGGTRKFFVEAKKPAVNIKDDFDPAFQLRRYAWSAKLPLSILTDFDEWAVYDTRVRPSKDDKPSTGRVLYLRGRELAERWDELAAIFSREAVLKGSFDKFAESTKRKKGTAEVDAAFLAEIESWRAELAKNLALRNPGLSQRDLNFAVQRIIDRIIFLRIAEDRGIEEYGRLQALTNGEAVYRRLGELFRAADDRYNSGLFHFEPEKDRLEPPDDLTLGLAIDDKLLRELIRGLYYPESPYEFSVLSADILGQVYEQFLGKVIKLTAGHRAIVEDKPEVKKAGGVYYTPTYIVDYIVRQTVGKLLGEPSPIAATSGRAKTPKQAAKLRFLDPACGSGSFLIGAYQYLLDWHRDWYVADGPEKHTKELYVVGTLRVPSDPAARVATASADGTRSVPTTLEYRLTAAERKRILLNNIYGVDIDPQAVEVTKLSLLLKVLEGASRDALERQRRFLHERALPDLGANIKCGNSLIGPDFYDGQQMGLFDEEEKYRLNVFDWSGKDGFAQIMKSGGFDAVIGNPPYVRQEGLKRDKDYFERSYKAFEGMADLYVYFIERASNLLKTNGQLAFIVSSSLLRATYASSLRELLQQTCTVVRVVDFGGLAIFANAKDTYVCIPSITKGYRSGTVEVSRVKSLDFKNLSDHVHDNLEVIPATQLTPGAWSTRSRREVDLVERLLRCGTPLGKYVAGRLFVGIKTGFNDAFELTRDERDRIVKKARTAASLIKPFLGGQNIRRYEVENNDRHLIVIPCGWTREQLISESKRANDTPSEREAHTWLGHHFAPIASHLDRYQSELRKRQDQGEYWWELRPCDYYSALDAPKIIYPDICKGPRFYLDSSGIYISNTAYCLGSDDPCLLGYLNSKLFWFLIGHISIPFGVRAGQFRYRLIYQYMEKVPVVVPDANVKSGRKVRDAVTRLVGQILKLHADLAKAKTGHAQTVIQRQIDATDRQIDQLVYQLYGLTDAEIALVEAATS